MPWCSNILVPFWGDELIVLMTTSGLVKRRLMDVARFIDGENFTKDETAIVFSKLQELYEVLKI